MSSYIETMLAKTASIEWLHRPRYAPELNNKMPWCVRYDNAVHKSSGKKFSGMAFAATEKEAVSLFALLWPIVDHGFVEDYDLASGDIPW